MRKIMVLFLAAGAALLLTACATAGKPTPQGAARGAQLELDLTACKKSATCPGYILCSDRVHRAYGLEPKKLVCEGGS